MKTLLNENISVEVLRLSKELSNAILKDIPTRQRKFSDITNKPFVEGTFNYVVDNRIEGINVLQVNYVVYLIYDTREYNSIITNETDKTKVNSCSDYDTSFIRIVSGYYVNHREMCSDFFSTIMHEVNHLYEYGKGLEKNVSLYDKVVEMVNHPDEKFKYVGYSLYYTFRHEQDSFAHQFYGFLKQNQPVGKFEDLLRYTELYQCRQCYDIVIKKYWNDKDLKDYFKTIGYTFEKWKKRVHYGMKRLEQKLKNAYDVYQNNISEFRLKHGVLILENFNEVKRIYGDDIRFSIEPFYDFGTKPVVEPLNLKSLF